MAVIPKPYRKFKLGAPRTQPRERALAQWRGIDLAPLQESRTVRVRGMGNLMPELLTKLGIDRRRGEAEVVKVWNNLIDPAIVAHAQPTGLNKGTLFVTVDSSVWLSEIVRYRRKEILNRLQHGFGTELIAKISFRVG
jgi:predicted nucleic acid-binding Zn ribbon protein